MNPVVIIDSGVGGLTIFDALCAAFPHVPLVYFFDNEAFPYGNKEEGFIQQRLSLCVEKICEQITPSLIIIACNTASTSALSLLRERFQILFVGVVPAIKPAAIASKNKCIGVLATKRTIEGHYLSHLIRHYANDCCVILVGSTLLAKIAEEKWQGKKVSLPLLKKILHPFVHREVIPDHIVLGCTHFLWLIDELKACCHHTSQIQWIDSNQAIVKRVQTLLKIQHDKNRVCAVRRSFFTKKQSMNKQVFDAFSYRKLQRPFLLQIPSI